VSMAGVFNSVALMMAVLTPLYTLRLQGAVPGPGAASAPVRPGQLVAGRWLAGLVFYLAAVAFTLGYVVLIGAYQRQALDVGAIAAGYLGIVLVGASWVAVGLLSASLTRRRVTAVLAGVSVLVMLQYVLGTLAVRLSPPLSDLLQYVSAADRAQSFVQGQVVLRDVVYFVTLTFGALFVASRAVRSRGAR
jgi:gliding motility-associated transport system permease protein